MIFRQCAKQLTPVDLFSRLLNHKDCFLLESASGPSHSARYSFLGACPSEKVESSGEDLKYGGRKRRERIDHFLHENMESRKESASIPYPYTGGFVGYFCYDIIRQFEKIPRRHAPSVFPDAELGLFTDGFIFDHSTSRCYYFSWEDDREREMVACDPVFEASDFSTIRSMPDREHYMDDVERARQYIIDGDIFQVVLSRRLEVEGMSGLLPFYSELRRINPSPYMYFVRFGERAVIGASPETLVSVAGRKVVTYPIAGTRPAVRDAAENDRLREELLHDKKELAEHNMLVDLARNDIGRVSEFGSVTVPEYMKVERYSHVQHIVSKVEGVLQKEKDPVDALFSVFPAGTVSGAPKIRAMEIIDELEHFSRGPYAGAVGYYSFNGCLDSAISIRTLFCSGHTAFLQAGGGIVYDSRPESEYVETENKMRALLTVFGKEENETFAD